MHEQRDLFELWMVLYITQEFVVDTAENGSWTEIRPAASALGDRPRASKFGTQGLSEPEYR